MTLKQMPCVTVGMKLKKTPLFNEQERQTCVRIKEFKALHRPLGYGYI